MTKIKKQHPVWTFFPSDDRTNSFICLKCNHSYPLTVNETVLKNHFMKKHEEIWKQIRYSTKIRRQKEKNKQKNIYYDETEEISTPSTINIESNNETLEHLQFEEQFQNNDEENQILNQENTIDIYSTNDSNIIRNIKSIELDYVMSETKTFTNELVENFLNLYNSKDDNHDMIIYIGKEPNIEKIYVHSIILRTRSVYFSRALSTNWVKKQNGYFILSQPNIDVSIFKIILKYIYCSILEFENFDIDMILKLLIIVDEFLIEELKDFIQTYLVNSELLQTYSCKLLNFINNNLVFTKLKKGLLETICEKPKILFNHKDFFLLDKDALKLIIEHDNLDMKESDIWKHIIKWGTNKDGDNLKEILCDLIDCIRFYQFLPNEFMDEVWNHKNILHNNLIEDMLRCYFNSKRKPLYDVSLIRWGNFTDMSTLINREIALLLTKLIDKKNIENDESKGSKYKFTCLYNSVLDGWSPYSFHSKCDNQDATIVITKLKNTTLIMGGYNPLDWNGIPQYKKTIDSFIFTIDYKDPKKYDVTYIDYNYIDYAVYCSGVCNPKFGESDFCITDKGHWLKCKKKSYFKELTNRCTLSLDNYEIFQVEDITKM
ncbi:9424_t:CDS:2 [Cetraspora pellucida]|uniref:9424_t:CDS:1 n=1 Tax=Cetraspora pellucida TaxID=1433469 RepID=A0ACA9LFX6_9GLOM|nr:9424_t:CDS:2 [Cetraspora pellucida]